jgi:hypothetical protein
MDPKLKKQKLTEERAIKFAYNKAKSVLMFAKKEEKTRKRLHEFFGIHTHFTEEKDTITNEDIDKLRDELLNQVKEKYDKSEAHSLQSDVGSTEQHGEGARDNRTTDYVIQPEVVETDDKEGTVVESTYVAKYPTQEAELLVKECNQVKAAKTLWDRLEAGVDGQLLLAQTGAGKTYILGSLAKNFIEHGYNIDYGITAPFPILYVTKASVVAQTEAVFRDEFGIDVVNTVKVVNIEFLRSYLGSLMVSETVEILQGQEHVVYRWNDFMAPCLIIWDECQILAREDSIQSKIAQDVSNIRGRSGRRIMQIFASATPFARVAEARCFACSTGASFLLGVSQTTITQTNWKQFAQLIAAPSDPLEYSEAAIKRLIDHLEEYIVRIKGIRPKHKALNAVERIHFKTQEERDEYQKAWDKYQEEKAKIEGDASLGSGESRFALLAQLTIFAQAAEYIRRYHLAEFIAKSWEAGFAPVLAVRFKQTQTAVYRILVEKYGWKREDITMIWGGSTQALSKKKKIARKMAENDDVREAMLKAMEEMGLSEDDLKDAGVDLSAVHAKTEEQLAFEKAHGLLTQKPEDRERERLAFQSQRSKCCIFNFKSGGVGLSLHHEAKYPNARQRVVLLTPVYSEKELVQGLGRCPRITSQSDTAQVMCYYHGTIEEHVAARVVMKLKCLKQVVKARESWEDIITGKPVIEEGSKEEELMDGVDAIEQGNELMEYVGKD